jgi:NAD(P)H-hydrate repair Nnr-like enzyme with NAD(P)H-hydrate epimerase domain
MEVQRMRPRPRPSRSILRAAAALAATVLLLAACGGDGGDGVTAGAVLHALVVNGSDADVTVSYTGAEAADTTQKTCSADIHNFPLADPFTVSIDGKTVIDSDVDLPDGIPNQGESDVIVRIDIANDGTVTFDRVRPGSDIGKPSKAAYCPTLPG